MKCRGFSQRLPPQVRGLACGAVNRPQGFDGPLKEWALTLGEPPRDNPQALRTARHLARQG